MKFLQFLAAIFFLNPSASYILDSKLQSREDLVVSSVSVAENFKLEFTGLKQWRTLNLENSVYIAGYTKDKIIIGSVINQDDTLMMGNTTVIDLTEEPQDLSIFDHWNTTSSQLEIIIIIAQGQNLLWYKLNNFKPILLWKFSIHKNITHINVFEMDYQQQLFIIAQHQNESTGMFYGFKLTGTSNLWFKQSIKLLNPTKSSAITNLGSDYFLTIPQKSVDALLIYKFDDGHFVSYKIWKSFRVDHVVAFEIGSKSFVAFSGLKSGILQFTRRGIQLEEIEHSQLEGLNYWLPIPINTYREEVILLIQRHLQHGQHKSFVIDFITYNGFKFEEHEDVTCQYLGENVGSLGCLPGEDSENGIMGSAALILNDTVAILVPRKTNSELFLLELTMVTIKNPVESQMIAWKETKQRLEQLIREQEKEIEAVKSAKSFRNSGLRDAEAFINFQSFADQLNNLRLEAVDINNDLKELNRNRENSKFKTVTINGLSEIDQIVVLDEALIEQIGNKPTETVLQDIILNETSTVALESGLLNDVETEELFIDFYNGTNATNLIFASNESLGIVANITFENTVEIANLNSMKLNNEEFKAFTLDNIPEVSFETIEILGNLSIQNLKNVSLNQENVNFANNSDFANSKDVKTKSLYIPKNIIVDTLNGENFNSFLKQLCLRNVATHIPKDITIHGNVNVNGNASLKILNNLQFPENFVFQNEKSYPITGSKKFTNDLTVRKLFSDGLVDGVNLTQIITLSSDQNVTGKTIFHNLEINGSVIGEDVNKFLPNPTISDEEIIKANVFFKNLKVEGDIILNGSLNGEEFDQQLRSIIYKNEEEVEIEAGKEFPKGFTSRSRFTVKSNKINNMNISEIVTKNTEQILNLTKINGDVSFGKVQISGTYNGFDVKQLDQSLVKLSGEQFISGTLNFEHSPLMVNNLEIVDKINNFTQENLAFVNTNHEFNVDEIQFEDLSVDNLEISGDIEGIIQDLDLKNFQQKRLSFSQDQQVSGKFKLQKSEVDAIKTRRINDFMPYELMDPKIIEAKVLDNLSQGKCEIENLTAASSVKIQEINGYNPINLDRSMWDNGIEALNLKKIIFRNDIFLNSLEISMLSGVNFANFIESIVFKNETNPEITGRKVFTSGFNVERLIETNELNNIEIYDILRKHKPQKLEGPLKVQGPIRFQRNLTVDFVNEFEIAHLTKNFEIIDNGYKIQGDILFKNSTEIDKLEVQGFLGEDNVTATLQTFVLKNKDFSLPENTVFDSKTIVKGNLRIAEEVNGIDLAEFASKVVLTTKDSTIETRIRFVQPTEVTNRLELDGSLKAKTISGVNLKSWPENAVFINRGILKGNFSFQNVHLHGNLDTEFLNEIDTSKMVPLKSQQNISKLSIGQVTCLTDIDVGKSVNEVYLPEEAQNTLMMDSNSDEEFVGSIEFLGKVFVETDLEIGKTLNNFSFDKLVRISADQTLQANYEFIPKITLEKNLKIDGLLNGIDISNWWTGMVKKNSSEMQNINMPWIGNNLIFEENVFGNGTVNNFDLRNLYETADKKIKFKMETEELSIKNYQGMCKDLTAMHNNIKHQIFKFDYFENFQTIQLSNNVKTIHEFQFQDQIFLLISEELSCFVHLMKWNGRFFQRAGTFEMGQIEQIVSILNEEGVVKYVAIKNDASNLNCQQKDINIWQFSLQTEPTFLHLAVAEDQDLLQDSQIPLTFYALSNSGIVTEFKFRNGFLKRYRKWIVNEDNVAFVPRRLATGLALTTGKKLIKLNRNELIHNLDIDYDEETESIISGNYTIEDNQFIPGRKWRDVTVIQAGTKRLMAVNHIEKTNLVDEFDFITIYDVPVSGKMYQKILAFQPESLTSLEFGNGESFIVFLENRNKLQVYEYKGLAGFQFKLSAKIQGSRLFTISLTDKSVIGIIDKNRVKLIKAVMMGNHMDGDMICRL